MEKSFTSWRESRKSVDNENDSDDSQDIERRTSRHNTILAYDSENESESAIVVSSSHSTFNVPDSDESFGPMKNVPSDFDKKRLSVVPDSEDEVSSDEDVRSSFPKLSVSRTTKTYRKSSDSHRTSTSSIQNSSSKLSEKEDCSITVSRTTNTDRKSSDSHRTSTSSIQSSTPKFQEEGDSNPEVIKFIKRKNKKPVISSDDEDSSVHSDFNIEDVISDEGSGKICVKETKRIIEDCSSTKSSTNSYEISDSEELKSPKANNVVEALKSKPIPVVDLTLPIYDNSNTPKKVVTSSAVQKPTLKDNSSVVDLTLPSYENSNVPKKVVTSGAVQKPTQNDYSSRMESLKAEQTRLDAQVKEVLKNIDSVKSSLKSANMAALPDKGVRLQLNLKRFESQLRDLRYQQNTLSNELLRLQFMPSHSNVPKPIQTQLPKQKIFKLPTTTTDMNAMSQRALENHRTQQALTVDALRVLHNSLKNCPSEETLSADPQGLKVELMPHQKYALSWLLWREKEKPSGGILADDMGLGKTLTMISLILKSNEEKEENNTSDESGGEEQGGNWLSSQRHKLIPGKTLVVCPASLLGQWEGEVHRRVRRGTVDVLVHHGNNREKKARRLAKPDLVITTYNIVSRDFDQPDSPLFQIKWERIILDEAHQIRNHKTKTAQAMFHLKARSRWVLTGTPVQNKELDLYALLKFLRCAPFDDLGVWKTWVDNRDAAGKQRLNTIIKSLMLRRTKKGLQEVGELRGLPDKSFTLVTIKMDEDEWAMYEKLLNFSKHLFAKFLHQKAEKENALQGIPLNPRNLQAAEDPFKDHPELARLHRQMKEISDVKSHHILMLLLRLRQFCCHPSLITSMLEKEDMSNVGIEDADGLDIDLVDKMTRMSIAKENTTPGEDNTDLTVMDKDNPLFSKDRLSSKLKEVVATVEKILEGPDKLLVVSQWVSYLDLVHAVLKERHIRCVRLTGQVPVKDRAELVDKFNRKDHGRRVMLLSLTAGGVGLNLVGANHLLLLDLHWNPQLENQACDRIYRVGQEKNVQIYKFVASDTLEESVLALQEKKVAVAESVLTGAKHTSSKLTLEDLKMLFKIN